jgi:hypothetical protein
MALNRFNNRPAALLVPQAHPVNLDTPVVPEMLVLQDPPAIPENRLLLLAKQPLLHHAIHAQLDHPDLLDHLDHLVMPEPLDNPVDPEMTVNPVNLDPRVPLDLLDLLEILEPLVNLVNLDHRAHLNLDHLDQPVMLEPLDPLANLVNLDKTADLAQLDPRAHPDHLANPDPMDIPDNPVLLDNLVVRARKVSAPSTVPSMVESSSRMELVVKRHDDLFIDLFYNFHHHHRHRFAIIAAFFFCIVVSSFVLPSNFLCLFHCLLFESLGRCVVVVCKQLCLNLTTSSSFLEHHPFDPHIQINRKNGSDSSQRRIESVFFTFFAGL